MHIRLSFLVGGVLVSAFIGLSASPDAVLSQSPPGEDTSRVRGRRHTDMKRAHLASRGWVSGAPPALEHSVSFSATA